MIRTPRNASATLPFSRPIEIDDVPDEGLDTRIEASLEECEAIAEDAGLPGVGSLVADYRIERRGHGRYSVRGELRARITQTCVVSLAPFESDKALEIDVTFAAVAPTVADKPARSRRHKVEPEPAPRPAALDGEPDPPDPIVDGTIDLGALALEFLTLAEDLYPRKPGVQFDDVVTEEATGEAASAFAALGRLKDDL